MGVRTFRPITPSLRFTILSDRSEITKAKPEKSLTEAIRKTGGRNAQGRITARWRGGGHRRRYRIIDFRRNKDNVEAKVAAIEYDPNRSARIALLEYADGEKRYIVAPNGLTVGDTLVSGESVEIKTGNCMPLENIPSGVGVHNIELQPGRGAQIVRSAGMVAEIMAKEGKFAHIKLPSGEVRLILRKCRATIGQVGHLEHEKISYGKAGRMRWLGWKPRVRAVAMNPVDHPMGGGEGKSSGGRHPCSPRGQMAKGLKTRRRKKSKRFIVRHRKAKR
jgi:large subunit ribosomal protein L2